jgi:hypothetical protein
VESADPSFLAPVPSFSSGERPTEFADEGVVQRAVGDEEFGHISSSGCVSVRGFVCARVVEPQGKEAAVPVQPVAKREIAARF